MPDLEHVQSPVLLDNRHVAYVTGLFGTPESDRSLQVRDLSTDRLEPAVDPRHEGGVAAARWRPDGRRVATSGADGFVRLWDGASGGFEDERQVADEVVTSLDYTRSGEHLVVAEESGTVRALDADTLEGVGKPYNSGLPLINVIGGSTDDTAIAIGRGTDEDASDADTSSVLLVDLMQGRLLRHAETDTIPWVVALSPDGRRLATVGDFGDLRILDLTTMQWLGPAVVAENLGAPSSVVWSPDGATVLAGGEGGALTVWDGRTGALEGTFTPGGDSEVAATFVVRGSQVLAVSADGSTHRWDSDPRSWVAFACEIAGRDLTPEEWTDELGDRPYQKVCTAR